MDLMDLMEMGPSPSCYDDLKTEQSDVVMDLMEMGPSPTCYDDLKTEQSDVVMDLMEMGPSPTCYDDLKTEQSDVVMDLMDLMEMGPSPTCYDDLKTEQSDVVMDLMEMGPSPTCYDDLKTEQSDVVMDLMEMGPSPTCYDDLKTAYIERRTPTTAERIQRLRKLGPLTSDQRPSDLLWLIERILGRDIDDDEIAKEEFLRRLPAQTQLIVRSQTDIFTVGQLAQMADRLASVPVISQDFGIS